MISHAFNMDGRAASQTITDKIPFLTERGIKPIVISGVLGNRDSFLEHYKLLPLSPAGLRFDLRHLIRRRVGSKIIYNFLVGAISFFLLPLGFVERLIFGLGSQASWAVTAFFKARRLIRARKIPIVYTTGGAYSAHLCGYWLKKTFRDEIRWLAELHDPLVAPGRAPRNRDEKFQAKLERVIAQNADLAWWFTDGALKSAIERNPGLEKKAFCILPGSLPRPTPEESTDGKKLRFGHFGSLTTNRSLSEFLSALASVIEEHPDDRASVEVHLYGSDPDSATQSCIKQLQLSDIVQIHGRIEISTKTAESGRSYIHRKMTEMNCLLIPHGNGVDCSEYIPSKFYDYLWANRPVFVISHGNSQFQALTNKRHGWFAQSGDPKDIRRALEEVFSLWAQKRLRDRWLNEPISTESSVEQILNKYQSLVEN